MANKKISALAALTTPASGDLIPITDVSDTSEAATGTTKKIAVSDLVTGSVVPDDSVTNAKLANMAAQTIKGRTTSGTGDPEDLTVTQAKTVLAITTADLSDFAEAVEDKIGAKVVAGAGMSVTYNDTTGDTTVTNTAVGGAGGFGDVVGPSSATDNALARFDSTTGKLIQSSTVSIDDTGAITVPEMAAPSTPGANKVALYAKSDGLLYSKDDAGAETALGGSSGAPATATYITQTADGGLSNEQALGALATGILKSTTTTGVVSIADVNDISSPVFAADAGANDTYTATLSPVPLAYVTGAHYRFKANTANTGACTINFNALEAKTIKKVAGGITTDLVDNDIRAGQWVDLVYDGTNMQMQSTLGNAAAVSYPLLAPNGSLSAPSFSFSGSTGTGMTVLNANNLTTIANGGEVMTFTRASSSSQSALMNRNTGGKIGWAGTTPTAGSLVAGFHSPRNGHVAVISDEGATPESGTLYSPTRDAELVGGTEIYIDMDKGQVRRYTLPANRSVRAPTNLRDGSILTLILIQDATGSRTITSWNSAYKFVGGSAPVLTTAANAVDIFRFWSNGTNLYELSRAMDVK